MIDRRQAPLLIVLVLCSSGAYRSLAAERKGIAAIYMGGTLSAPQPKTSGSLDINQEDILHFKSKKASFPIQCKKISNIEFGTKSSVSAGTVALLGVAGLFMKEKNYQEPSPYTLPRNSGTFVWTNT